MLCRRWLRIFNMLVWIRIPAKTFLSWNIKSTTMTTKNGAKFPSSRVIVPDTSIHLRTESLLVSQLGSGWNQSMTVITSLSLNGLNTKPELWKWRPFVSWYLYSYTTEWKLFLCIRCTTGSFKKTERFIKLLCAGIAKEHITDGEKTQRLKKRKEDSNFVYDQRDEVHTFWFTIVMVLFYLIFFIIENRTLVQSVK